VTALDGLRGLLAASVVVHHCLFFRVAAITGTADPMLPRFYAQMGVAPVTLFFFITGYLFWQKLRRRNFDTGKFIARRLARLGPAYWAVCVLFFLLVASASAYQMRVPASSLASQIAGWLIFFAAGHDLNAITGSRYWLGQVWTLRMEWCFYLSLPLLGWFARAFWRFFLLFAVAICAATVLPTLASGGVASQIAAFLAGYAKMFSSAFVFGIAAATSPVERIEKRFLTGVPASVLVCVLLAAVLFLAPARYGWLESSLLFLPFLCASRENTWFKLLTSPALQLLGRISYSIYLLHSLVVFLGIRALMSLCDLGRLAPAIFWSYSLALVFLTAVLSAFWWRWLEFPFLHGFPNVRRMRPAIGGGALRRVNRDSAATAPQH
jgi:peptidoglycan/LPS O-acetylase OafA/YrhL